MHNNSSANILGVEVIIRKHSQHFLITTLLSYSDCFFKRTFLPFS